MAIAKSSQPRNRQGTLLLTAAWWAGWGGRIDSKPPDGGDLGQIGWIAGEAKLLPCARGDVIREWYQGANQKHRFILPSLLNGVWTEPGENVWIAGFFGSMGQLKEDGSWDCATSPPTFETFHAVAKHGDEILFAGGNFLDQGGNYGTIGRFGTNDAVLTATACETN